ncbi:probable terpene synthase 6 [Tripterygium wilfordii]|uniref:probable terpene synthase 6 n=1 Tax=Tripterygium wilfordii TaxID=458696 RepID=UPI0018F80FBA|nr:probable terpene synthase 6 [Tripterygium wilfordii]
MARSSQPSSRPLANFSPSVWNQHDFASFSLEDSAFDSYTEEIEALKVKVKDMLMTSPSNHPVQKIVLIDLLCRLGLSCHFDHEIQQQLEHIFDAEIISFDENRNDLHTIALMFRVFRQHGYKMSSDVFKRFKNDESGFNASLASDVKGLLSLYEASHLSIHGEDILDEALEFTRTHLKFFMTQSSPHLARHISETLLVPFHKGLPRIEARKYISLYERDDSRNDPILKFAKIDFNRVQLLHKLDLCHLSRWYKDTIDIESNFPFARDRLLESFLVGIGTFFEPQYTRPRIIMGKLVILITILDDTFDAYGTLEELECFTNAMERWDIAAMDELPDYMRPLYKILLSFFDELEKESKEEGRAYAFSYVKDGWKAYVRGNLVEAQWCNAGYVPTFDEYLKNGLITSCCHILPLMSFFVIGEIATLEAFEWLESSPKFVTASQTIGCLVDDIRSHKFEQKRRHVASAVECYMKQYGITEEEAVTGLKKMVTKAWKDINEERMRASAVSMELLKPLVGLMRTVEELYKMDDGFTDQLSLKDNMTSLVVDEVSM